MILCNTHWTKNMPKPAHDIKFIYGRTGLIKVGWVGLSLVRAPPKLADVTFMGLGGRGWTRNKPSAHYSLLPGSDFKFVNTWRSFCVQIDRDQQLWCGVFIKYTFEILTVWFQLELRFFSIEPKIFIPTGWHSLLVSCLFFSCLEAIVAFYWLTKRIYIVKICIFHGLWGSINSMVMFC